MANGRAQTQELPGPTPGGVLWLPARSVVPVRQNVITKDHRAAPVFRWVAVAPTQMHLPTTPRTRNQVLTSSTRHTDCLRFDPASLAILERLNYAVSLLESQANQPQTPAAVPAQPPMASNTAIDEAAHEIEILELSVPSSMSAAHLLEWPIFGNKYDRKYLNAALFEHSPCTTAFDGDTGSDEVADAPDAQSAQRSKMPGKGIQKEEVHDLIQAFLENVHTKNPVLDSTDLMRWATPISEHGFGWSSRSCLLVSVPPP